MNKLLARILTICFGSTVVFVFFACISALSLIAGDRHAFETALTIAVVACLATIVSFVVAVFIAKKVPDLEKEEV